MTYLDRGGSRAPIAVPLLSRLLDWAARRATEAALDHLDDRQRCDIGLAPRGDRTLSRSEVAARIALLALR